MSRRDDWWCPTCQFRVFGSKPACLKCGYQKPKPAASTHIVNAYSRPAPHPPIVIDRERFGPYSYLKGGYYGARLEGEPEGLRYPHCGCQGYDNCPERHHDQGCGCYTCRGKTHKW